MIIWEMEYNWKAHPSERKVAPPLDQVDEDMRQYNAVQTCKGWKG